MKTNDKKISGVLHKNNSAQHYQLRRYLPKPELADLVEQFWLVDWDLRGQSEHIQQNLPDPNIHLVIQLDEAKILGPVSKKYHYCMQGQGKIIGVKFKLGVLAKRFPCTLDKAVDCEFEAADILLFDQQKLIETTLNADCDKDVVTRLHETLRNIVMPQDSALSSVQALAEQIKNNNEIKRVEMLADISHTSVRTLQRLFKTYVGLSPKWLIRKYRLSHALEMLENRQLSLTELAANLDYADQSHLIRDFNGFLDITPKQYKQAPKPNS